MQLPRMTIRRWIFAVAFIGVMFGVQSARERSRRCRAMASFHADEGRYELAVANSPPVYYVRCSIELELRTPEERRRELESRPSRAEYRAFHLNDAEYHLRLKEKFERAAWRPWESFPDDPPYPPE